LLSRNKKNTIQIKHDPFYKHSQTKNNAVRCSNGLARQWFSKRCNPFMPPQNKEGASPNKRADNGNCGQWHGRRKPTSRETTWAV
jgi:hypothetical protein